MEIAFESQVLRSTCEHEDEAANELGPEVAEMLKRRLADIRAATSIADLVVGRPRIVVDVSGEQLVVDLTKGYEIAFAPNHPKNPLSEAGGLDWSKVRRLRLLRIGRRND